jgi:23S rRNA pseudouridine955/2504/2580 synthase
MQPDMTQTSRPSSNPVRYTQISADEAGQRIDNYLLRQFKGVPKSHIYRILRKGEVRVNKKRIKPTYKLTAGDEVRLPPVRTAERQTRRPPDEVIQRLESRIIYDDDRIILVNKPAGLAVHAGSGVEFGVIDAIQQLYKQPGELFLVHRLDRDTSGCLLIARDRQALRYLQQALQENRVKKYYTALVMGHWDEQENLVDMPLRRNKLQSGERLVQVDDTGKSSVSIFRTIRVYARKPEGIGASLMKIQLITGRTHQIRVHSAESGHPLAGDSRYGDEAFNRKMKSFGLKRMFLHASALDFPHPDNDQPMHIEPPIEEALQQVLDRLDQ